MEYKMKRFTLALALLVVGAMVSNPNAQARSLNRTQQLLFAQAQPESSRKLPQLKLDLQDIKLTRPVGTRSVNSNQVQALLQKAIQLNDSKEETYCI
jgi:hypothetical protein